MLSSGRFLCRVAVAFLALLGASNAFAQQTWEKVWVTGSRLPLDESGNTSARQGLPAGLGTGTSAASLRAFANGVALQRPLPKSENNSEMSQCGESTDKPVLLTTGEKYKDETD